VADQAEPGVVVEGVEDFYVGAVGQGPVGDVELPAFVGLFGLEPDVAAFGALVGLWSDKASGGEDPPDRGHCGAGVVALLKVKRDGGCTGLVPVAVEFFA
jgi:hypothetical protein